MNDVRLTDPGSEVSITIDTNRPAFTLTEEQKKVILKPQPMGPENFGRVVDPRKDSVAHQTPYGTYYEKKTVTTYRKPRSENKKFDKKPQKYEKREFKPKKQLEPVTLYHYLKDIYDDVVSYDKEEFFKILMESISKSQTQVTTLLLYTADVRGLNRPDIVNDAFEVVMNPKVVGFTFRRTLIKGLVYRNYWRLIFKILEFEKVDNRTRGCIFGSVKIALKKNNPKALREMPRQGVAVNRVRGFLHMTPAEWRHTLVDGSTNSLFARMSNGEWSMIDYAKLPVFLISSMYKGFMRHDRSRFTQYLKQNKQIARASYQIKTNFKKHPFSSIEEIVKNYFVPMNPVKQQTGRFDKFNRRFKHG